jgi:hypothetical protein
MGVPPAGCTPVYEVGRRERATHIDIRRHFAHEAIQNGKLIRCRVASWAKCILETRRLRTAAASKKVCGIIKLEMTILGLFESRPRISSPTSSPRPVSGRASAPPLRPPPQAVALGS